MIYEIINPSDPYTLVADTLEVSALAVCLIGEGHYMLKPLDPEAPGVPAFCFGLEADPWFLEQFTRTFAQSMDYVLTHGRERLIDALDSVLIGTIKERQFVNDTCVGHSMEGRKALLALWHETHRSSMNDIGTLAWAWADALRTRSEG